ncbi:MAG: hypothetical protein G8D28_06405 [gamma proteobacterium symbiont of Phacoides pectinatus]
MALEKNNVIFRCEECTCVLSDDSGRIDVVVPVSIKGSEVRTQARLRCDLSAVAHRIELMTLDDAEAFSGEHRRELTEALDFVAAKRICGNRQICPDAVIWAADTATGRTNQD